jgi:small-conductance mechanosensitive channel
MLDHWVKNISTILSDPLNGLGITFILALIIVFINCKALWLQDQSLDTIMMTLMLFLVMAMFNSEKIDLEKKIQQISLWDILHLTFYVQPP